MTIVVIKYVCNVGLPLSGESIWPEDLNWCGQVVHACEYKCVNMIDTYRCSCGLGQVLGSDNRTCHGESTADLQIVTNDTFHSI